MSCIFRSSPCFCSNSAFFAAMNSAGTPPTVDCADKSRVHSFSMNAAAPCLSINPTREICIFLGSGIGLSLSSSIPKAYSTTTSSSILISSVTFWAIHGLSTDRLILRRSTFSEKFFGNLVDFMLIASLSLNLESCAALVPRIPTSAILI